MTFGVISSIRDMYNPPVGFDESELFDTNQIFQDILFDDFFMDNVERDNFFDQASKTSLNLDPNAVNLAASMCVPAQPKPVATIFDSSAMETVQPVAPVPPPPVTTQNKRKRPQTSDTKRFINRVNARNSRIRSKFKLASLAERIKALEQENKRLKTMLNDDTMGEPVAEANLDDSLATISSEDFSMMDCLIKQGSNFCITDPHKPDNPIVKASSGFFEMTGYNPDDVIGKNCRFLQGPGTKLETVRKLREAMEKGEAVAVTLLNYKKDGSPFWNQVYTTPIMGSDGKSIVHFVGIQREVIVKGLPKTK